MALIVKYYMSLQWTRISFELRKYWSKYRQSNIFLTKLNFSSFKKTYLIKENEVSSYK